MRDVVEGGMFHQRSTARPPPQMNLDDWDSSGPRDQLIWDDATPRALVDKNKRWRWEMRFTYVVVAGDPRCEVCMWVFVRIACAVM